MNDNDKWYWIFMIILTLCAFGLIGLIAFFSFGG